MFGQVWKKILTYFLTAAVFWTSIDNGLAAELLSSSNVLPAPGQMVGVSQSYAPALIKGIKVYPDEPFKLDFIIDTGRGDQQETALKKTSAQLIKYFLTSLTIPEKNVWVNLSPYESDRISPQDFGSTEMGQDLLAQDYILKQLSATLMSPEQTLGKKFWARVYEKARQVYGTAEIPVNTFHKVWIVPEKAVVYENGNTAFIANSRLKVMMEDDFLAMEKNRGQGAFSLKGRGEPDNSGRDIFKEMMLPIIEQEVNTNKNFAPLRQIYHSLILAAWFKKSLREAIINKMYSERSLTAGVSSDDQSRQEEIYNQYVESFQRGVVNLIKEEVDSETGAVIPRKYFSGGCDYSELTPKVLEVKHGRVPVAAKSPAGQFVIAQSYMQGIDDAAFNKRTTRRGFIRGVVTLFLGAGLLFSPGILSAQSLSDVQASEAKTFWGYFSSKANPQTGFSLSHFGDNDPVRAFGAQTYDLSLRAIAEAGFGGGKILNTYSLNNTTARGESAPQTMDANYAPAGGVLSNIRISNFTEPEWWNRWEFKVSAGDNAWIGIAAMHHYTKTNDSKFLDFAKKRAEFLMQLQDKDGGIRFGSRGQWHKSGNKSFFWEIKSTENNESALYFFDMLYALTKDMRYKKAADQIYSWLVGEMYDPKSGVFRRGIRAHENVPPVKDSMELFAPDTTSWAPLERMLNDPRFGASREARLQKFEKIMQTTEQLAGVFQDGVFKGLSFSPESKREQIISIEWSSQYALRYWRMSEEYAFLKNGASDQARKSFFAQKEAEYKKKYENLMRELKGYFKSRDGFLVAPYAVYADGRVAADRPTGHEWDTPQGFASAANIYYAFAVAKFDPCLPDRSMMTAVGVPVNIPQSYDVDGRLYPVDLAEVQQEITFAFARLQDRSDFDISGIKGIDVVDVENIPNDQDPFVMQIPVQLLVPSKEAGNLDFSQSENTRKELLDLVVYHEQGVSQGLGEEESEVRDLRYMGTLDIAYPKVPEYENARTVDYRVIVPIYNEEDVLEDILQRIKERGYLKRVFFVNDASTDRSKEILEQWRKKEGIEVLHLKQNKKKEGAIREVLENLEQEGRLTDKVLLVDADSFLEPVDNNKTLDAMIAQVSAHMDSENLVGMALRQDIHLPNNANWIQKAMYAEFASLRFVNKISSKKNQLWVINGRGGIFKSEVLLNTLRHMEYDFETGDFLITVSLMKAGHKIAYFDQIKVNSWDVSTVKEYFKQRRRWERGTLKVMFNEPGFFIKEMSRFSRFGMQTMLFLATNFSVPFGADYFLRSDMPAEFYTESLPLILSSWWTFNVAVAITDPAVRNEGFRGRLIQWHVLNAILYSCVAMPARFVGIYDGLKYLFSGRASKQSAENPSKSKKTVRPEMSAGTVSVDAGMVTAAPGGIALDASMFGMEIQKDTGTSGDMGRIYDLPRITGLYPVVMRIVPADLSTL